jgi:hypothetical protein
MVIDVYKHNHLSDKSGFHNQLVIIGLFELHYLLVVVILIRSNLYVVMMKEVLVIKMVMMDEFHHHHRHDKNHSLEYHYRKL